MLEIIIVCIIGYIVVNCFVDDKSRREEINSILFKIVKYALYISLAIFGLTLFVGFSVANPALAILVAIAIYYWINERRIL